MYLLRLIAETTRLVDHHVQVNNARFDYKVPIFTVTVECIRDDARLRVRHNFTRQMHVKGMLRENRWLLL